MSTEQAVEKEEEPSSKSSLFIDTDESEPSKATGAEEGITHEEEPNNLTEEEEKPNSTTSEIEETTRNEELEKMFADRYTEQNSSYAEIAKGFPPVIVIHPWTSRTKRIFDYTRGRGDHRGGWRGGRDNNWRGGRGGGRGNWRGGGGDRGNWRGGGDGGGYRGKRSWDNNGDRSRNDQGGDRRVHYPGRY